MIEVVTLDLIEQIIAKMGSPLLSADAKPGTWLLSDFKINILYSGDSTVASSLAQALATPGGGNDGVHQRFLSSDFSKVWISAAAPAYKTMLFDLAAETITFDDSVGRGFTQMYMDNAGNMWAQATQAGYYGLWKRTGTSTWTQMLSDSTIATGLRIRPSDGTLWYQSSTSNHYQIANGTATLASAPTGTLIQVSRDTTTYYMDAPVFMPGGQFGGSAGSGPNLFKNADGTTNTTPNPIVPYEPSGLFPRWTGNDVVCAYQFRIDATYSLIWCHGSGISSYSAYQHFYVINKATGTIKQIGTLPFLGSGTVQDCNRLTPIATKWNGNYLRIYLAGSVVCQTSPATTNNYGGIMSLDIACSPNF